jgi:transcriptional regulator with PAS, ATPase and Fis domain
MDDAFAAILGESDAAEEVRAFGRLAARVDAPVLLTGESGTGKGILAHAIHRTSARTPYPFIAVNCAGVPESLFESEFFGYVRGAFTGAVQTRRGLLEQANRGSLFLDEVGELSCGLQAKLLTALEVGEFRRLGAESSVRTDARVIAATSADLEAAVQRGDFRIDFYHRLLVLSFRLPPLRERGADIGLLSRHYLESFARKHRRAACALHDATLHALQRLTWPGNVRQLAHAIEAALLVCDGAVLMPEHLPQRLLSAPADADDAAPRYSFFGGRTAERDRILAALRKHRGNRTRAARALGMARNTLRARIAALRIDELDPGRD